MTTWMMIELPRAQQMVGAEIKITNTCEALFMAASAPRGAAVFAEGGPRDQTQRRLYFTPAMWRLCGAVLGSYNPIAVSPPAPEKVSTLIINEHDRTLIFPPSSGRRSD